MKSHSVCSINHVATAWVVAASAIILATEFARLSTAGSISATLGTKGWRWAAVSSAAWTRNSASVAVRSSGYTEPGGTGHGSGKPPGALWKKFETITPSTG